MGLEKTTRTHCTATLQMPFYSVCNFLRAKLVFRLFLFFPLGRHVYSTQVLSATFYTIPDTEVTRTTMAIDRKSFLRWAPSVRTYFDILLPRPPFVVSAITSRDVLVPHSPFRPCMCGRCLI